MTVHAQARTIRSLLLYSHDTYGLGHLRRNLAIATHMLETTRGLQVLLMTGSPVSRYFAMPQGLSVVSLPSVTKCGAEKYVPLDPSFPLELVRSARTAIMTDVLARFRPDVFLVDHAPKGMGGELLPVFDALREVSPRTHTVLGLRDVLDEPTVVRHTWREQDIPAVLEAVYDQILVYGYREMFDVGHQYGLSAPLASRLTYCGYLGRPEHLERPATTAAGRTGAPFVLGTAGGGADGAQVLAATLAASRVLSLRARLVTGPLMSRADRAALVAAAAGPGDIEVVEFLPQLRDAMASAAAVVTMGGYNTLCEVVSTGVPTVVVPRTSPRQEQVIRARMFAHRGLLDVVLPGPDLVGRLTATLRRAVAGATSAPSQELDLRGLNRLERHLHGGNPAERPASHRQRVSA